MSGGFPYSRRCLALLSLLAAFSAQAQFDTILPFRKEKVSHVFAYRDPMGFVDELTRDKKTDPEKFEAIFSWVANNIRYDYRAYYSPYGSRQRTIRHILLYRRALCHDYARLMDTLCSYAQLINVSVPGYAKDELFDVNDSVYFDNHVWNAVKLDNQWYLYDLTWSLGGFSYRFTRFSQFVVNLKRRFRYSVVPVMVKVKYGRHSGAFGCADTSHVMPRKITVYKTVFRHRWLYRILDRIPIKITLAYTESRNRDYYLARPDVFAITHSPDDPVWFLMGSRSMRAWEADSAYYHLEPAVYTGQKRGGRNCSACDGVFAFRGVQKEVYERKASLGYNRRNRVFPAAAEYAISGFLLDESKTFADSLTKIEYLDSALHFVDYARRNFARGSALALEEQQLRLAKNRNKLDLLLEENAGHRAFIHDIIRRTGEQMNNVRDLESAMAVDVRNYYYRKQRISRYKRSDAIRQDNAQVDQTILALSDAFEERERKIDSLNDMISERRGQLAGILPGLNEKLNAVITRNDSIIAPLTRRSRLRESFYDGYKKPVVSESRVLASAVKAYTKNADSGIYHSARSCYETGMALATLIRERNLLRLQNHKACQRLFAFRAMRGSDLDDYVGRMDAENQADACWILGNTPQLQKLFYRFKQVVSQQKVFEGALEAENKAERWRFFIINREIGRQARRLRNIVRVNTKLVNRRRKEISREKREFLKQLRKERQEERKSR